MLNFKKILCDLGKGEAHEAVFTEHRINEKINRA